MHLYQMLLLSTYYETRIVLYTLCGYLISSCQNLQELGIIIISIFIGKETKAYRDQIIYSTSIPDSYE